MTITGARVRTSALKVERGRARLRTRVLRVDGRPVTIDEGRVGEGPTVVLLHGFSADRDVWVRFASRLRGHHLVVPDLAGHGASGFVSGSGHSAPDQARRVVALLDALGIERAHLIGNSMGGFIAATTALLSPERVWSIALVDAAGVTSPVPSPLERMLEAGRNPFLLQRSEEFDAFYAMTMAKGPFVPRFVRRAIAADYVSRRDQLSEIFDDFAGRDLLDDRLGEITAPAWVAWGRKDELIDVSAARVWADGLRGARLSVYDDLGHMPMLEAPRRVARDYQGFLGALPS